MFPDAGCLVKLLQTLLALKPAALKEKHAIRSGDELAGNGDSGCAAADDTHVRLEQLRSAGRANVANHGSGSFCLRSVYEGVTDLGPRAAKIQAERVLAMLNPVVIVAAQRAEENLAAALAVQFDTDVTDA